MAIDPARLRTWVEGQLEERAPTAELEGAGQAIQELASALGALERGGGQLFGMNVDSEGFAAVAPLAPRARALLGEWRTHLQATHGHEGAQMVASIAARVGILLDERDASTGEATAEDPAMRAALDTLDHVLHDSGELSRFWRELYSAEHEEVVVVLVGEPNAAHAAKHFALYRATYDAELPACYRMLVERFNGLTIYSNEDAEAGEAVTTVSVHELGEPLLWPVESYGDHEQLVDADFDDIALPYVFGEIADSGMFAFDVSPEAPVFWIPRDFASEAPTRLTDSLAEFIQALADARGSGSALLRARRVPGWA